MTVTHPQDRGSIGLGLNIPQQHPQLWKNIRRYINWRETHLTTEVQFASRLVDDDAGVRALVEISTIVPTHKDPFVLMEISFWDDGLITVGDQEFQEPAEHGLDQPMAAIPVTNNIEFGNVADLIEWLRGIVDTESRHRFVSAERLLQEINDRLENHEL